MTTDSIEMQIEKKLINLAIILNMPVEEVVPEILKRSRSGLDTHVLDELIKFAAQHGTLPKTVIYSSAIRSHKTQAAEILKTIQKIVTEPQHKTVSPPKTDHQQRGWQTVEARARTTVDGKLKPIVRETNKIGRNSRCHCGSGKKYKVCHGAPKTVNCTVEGK